MVSLTRSARSPSSVVERISYGLVTAVKLGATSGHLLAAQTAFEWFDFMFVWRRPFWHFYHPPGSDPNLVCFAASVAYVWELW
jgi:hypothetical protein